MIDRSIADEAGRLIGGERDDDYGPPHIALGRVADLWAGYLGVPVTAADVAKMMLLLKLARTAEKYKRDSFVDGVAYLLIAEDLDRGCSK
jgi:hypothetical protein